ncbi:ABC transporter ATP-binding protein [Microvirga sp. W0021]|uniref:ABC transporter ATP-binding protein n=1 Tax=Hohaiivirga grylli TaxID=3133970 RepID=A0ABV0BF11_9HYPH
MAKKNSQKLTFSKDTWPILMRMWREWVKPYTGSLLLILCLVILIAGTASLYPVLVKMALDAFTDKSQNIIMVAPIFIIVVTAVKGFSMLGQTVLTNRVVSQIEADMQLKLYSHLIDGDISQIGRQSSAALTQRFTTDFTYIKEALTRISTVFLRDTATIIAVVIAMIWIDPILTLASAVVAPFVAPPIAKIGKKLRRMSTSTQEQIGEMAGLVSESLQGARVAKTYNLEDYLKGKAASSFNEIRLLKVKAANARGRLDPLLEIAGGIALAGVLFLIGWRIMAGQSSVGDFAGFVTALLLASQPIRTLGNLSAIIQEAVAALVRYYAIVDEKPTIVDTPDAKPINVSKGKIRLENVVFKYREDVTALDHITLTIPAGKTTALVGRSGSGKSTMMSLVPRLYDVTDGALVIDGQDIREVTQHSLRDKISVVSQDVMLFDDTIRANIALGRNDADEERIIEAAKAAAAHDFIMKAPEGYDSQVGSMGTRLSGGERQRISLARAFYKNAPILLLDEATSALDSESERLVQQAIRKLMHGRTTLVIAHRLSTVRDADMIVVMEAGKIIETGTHDELITKDGAYARLYRLQLTDDVISPA